MLKNDVMQEMLRLRQQAYRSLKLENGASPAIIEQAYQRLSLKYQFYRQPDDSYARQRFEAIQSAYEVLTGPMQAVEEMARQNLAIQGRNTRDGMADNGVENESPPPTYYVPAPREETSSVSAFPVTPLPRPVPTAPPMASFNPQDRAAARQAQAEANMESVQSGLSFICQLLGKVARVLLVVALFYESSRSRQYRDSTVKNVRSTYLDFGFFGVSRTEYCEKSQFSSMGFNRGCAF